jgi:hypothetical protein
MVQKQKELIKYFSEVIKLHSVWKGRCRVYSVSTKTGTTSCDWQGHSGAIVKCGLIIRPATRFSGDAAAKSRNAARFPQERLPRSMGEKTEGGTQRLRLAGGVEVPWGCLRRGGLLARTACRRWWRQRRGCGTRRTMATLRLPPWRKPRHRHQPPTNQPSAKPGTSRQDSPPASTPKPSSADQNLQERRRETKIAPLKKRRPLLSGGGVGARRRLTYRGALELLTARSGLGPRGLGRWWRLVATWERGQGPG